VNPLDGIRFVLVRPERGGNVGAAARALKNMGGSDLVLVSPSYTELREARRLAHGAEDVLYSAPSVKDLPAALADCRWTVGTTRRTGQRRQPVQTPRSLAQSVLEQPHRRPLALVFGAEREGLTSAELDLCQEILHIPTSEAQPSLNLAQAVLVVAYELFLVLEAAASPGPPGPEATAAELEGQYEHLREAMLEIGFARPETVDHCLRAVRRLLGRAQPSTEEVTLLRGLWRQTLWAARNKPEGT
jgi:TrmH family RNA methyltransferase